MATKKQPEETVQPEEAAQAVANDVEVVDAAPYDPWQDKREIYIPKMSQTEQDTLEIGLNDKTYFVPKGKMVSLPYPLYAIVREMIKRRELTEKRAKAMSGVKPLNSSVYL